MQSQLKELDGARRLVSPESREYGALQASVATLALQLSAYVLIKRDTRRLVLTGIVVTAFVGTYLVFRGYLGPGDVDYFLFFPFGGPHTEKAVDISLITAGLITFFTGYVAAFIYLYLRLTERRRQRFILRLMQEPATVDSDTILKISHHWNHHVPSKRARVEAIDGETASGTGATPLRSGSQHAAAHRDTLPDDSAARIIANSTSHGRSAG